MLEVDRIYETLNTCMITKEFALKLYSMASKCTKGIIVEIGSNLGCSTISIATGVRDSGSGIKFVSIDPHNNGGATLTDRPCQEKDMGELEANYINQGINLDEYLCNLEEFGVFNIVTVICDYSELAYDKWKKEPIEMLFIDGDHRYHFVKMDTDLYLPHVIKGGYVILDDCAYPGVFRIIEELKEQGIIEPVEERFGIYRKL